MNKKIEPLSAFTTTRPRRSGYYLVMWEPMTIPIRAWITFTPASGGEDEYWSWGWSKFDDPESIELDISDPSKIQFAEL